MHPFFKHERINPSPKSYFDRCNVKNWPYWKITPGHFSTLKSDPGPFSTVEIWPGVTSQQFGVTFQRWKVTFFIWSHFIMTPLHFENWPFCWILIRCKLSNELNGTKRISNIELCMRVFVSIKRTASKRKWTCNDCLETCTDSLGDS